MSYTQHLSTVLTDIKTAKGWSQAYTYPCPDRPDHVVFHSNLLSATAIKRVVVSDMASKGPKFVAQLAGTIVDHGNGTDHCQILCPRGADPDAVSVTLSGSDWDSMSPADQEEGLATGRVIAVVHGVPAEDTPPAAEVAAEGPCEQPDTPTYISESRPFPPTPKPTPGPIDLAGVVPDNPCQPPAMTTEMTNAQGQPCRDGEGVARLQAGEVVLVQNDPAHQPIASVPPEPTTMLSALVEGTDLDDDQAAFVVRQNLEVAIATMKGKPAFNAAISLVRSGLGVCPKTSITV